MSLNGRGLWPDSPFHQELQGARQRAKGTCRSVLVQNTVKAHEEETVRYLPRFAGARAKEGLQAGVHGANAETRACFKDEALLR